MENVARGRYQRFVRVRGYKFMDEYARVHGFKEQREGTAAMTIFDPERKSISVFVDVEEGPSNGVTAMLKEILVEWDTYNFRVWCVIGAHRYLQAYVKKRHRRVYRCRATADLVGMYFKSLPKKGGILWLPKVPRSAKDIGYLAHEVGHAVMDMHVQCGLHLDSRTDETFCYALAHGVTAVLDFCREVR